MFIPVHTLRVWFVLCVVAKKKIHGVKYVDTIYLYIFVREDRQNLCVCVSSQQYQHVLENTKKTKHSPFNHFVHDDERVIALSLYL